RRAGGIRLRRLQRGRRHDRRRATLGAAELARRAVLDPLTRAHSRPMASGGAWEERDGALRRTIEFADFSEAFAFMTRVALLAESRNHHPDWSNSWNKVE